MSALEIAVASSGERVIQPFQHFLPRYQSALARHLLSEDDFARESALFDSTELGKLVSAEAPSIDELRELHRLALQALIGSWRSALPGSADRAALERLNRGDAGPFGIAFILPHEMAQLRLHEQRWRREHGKLIALFEQTDDLIAVINERGGMESVNPAFSRLTGWSSLEALTHMAAIWRGPLPTLATREVRCAQFRRDGSSFMVEWSISPIHDHDGQLLSYVCIGRDISRRQQIEDSLRENDKLRAVATLAGGIAHDFNNLLGSILGLAELCELEANAGSRQARNLGRIRQAGVRAAALVRQMLDFSRQTPKAVQRMPASQLLAHAGGLMRAAMPAEMLLTTTVLEDGPISIDLVQMEQVLLNLTGNAVHAMRGRDGEVCVRLDRAEPVNLPIDDRSSGRRHLRFRVTDAGVGIAAEVLPKIFDPFFTTKPVGEGTGLGLAAVHGIVSNHGGVIEVDSALGVGTTFSVFLPLDEGDGGTGVDLGAVQGEAADGG